MYDIAYSRCPDYEYSRVRPALEDVLAQVTDFSWLRPGMTVAIKANLVTGAAPERAATTHPAVIQALCDILSEKGARPIVGDSPGGPYTAVWLRHVYAACGLTALRNVTLNQDLSELHISAPEAAICREFDCTAYLTRADAVISLCKLKTHGMMSLTAGVKNLFGAIPGTKKPEYHFRFPRPGDFADALVDICQYFSPVLTVCDAVIAMEGNGPTAGTPYHAGLLAAAPNPHALDASLARLIGLDPLSVPTIAAAQRRRLLLSTPSVSGQPEPLADFVLPDTGGILFEGRGGLSGRIRSAVLNCCLSARPVLDTAHCSGCGKCAAICPAGAITLRGGRPHIHRSRCICCFCCQEFCPRGALHARRSPIARLINKEVH